MFSLAHEKYRGRGADPCRAAGCLPRRRSCLRSTASLLGSSGIDEEPHFIRLSDEDRMVEILGGVLEARADVLPLQIKVVSKNLIL